jgi:hypothetical protein
MRDRINKSKSQTYFFNRSNVIKKNPVIYIENNWNVKKWERLKCYWITKERKLVGRDKVFRGTGNKRLLDM